MLPACKSDGNIAETATADSPSTQQSYSDEIALLQISGFKIIRTVGKGGMGVVYEAEDESLGRRVALKVLRGPVAQLSEAERRFRREVIITGRLQHPGIVPVYTRADASGQPCYVMRLVEGETLAEAIRRLHAADNVAPQPPPMLRHLLQCFVAVCRTIAYAHSRGVIHRDIKPANIMLGAFGESLVLDWGLAKEAIPRPTGDANAAALSLPARSEVSHAELAPAGVTNHASEDCTLIAENVDIDFSATMDGSALGTPAYMAPEQARGELDRVGPLADVYSLGATLFALLTGTPPVQGSLLSVLARVRDGLNLSPRAQAPSSPKPLDAVVRRATAREPNNRYTSALELADDIERWLSDEPVLACREPPMARFARWCRHHRTLVVTGLALLFVTFVATTIGTIVVTTERQRTARAAFDAEVNRRAATEVAGLLDGLFRSADPIGFEGFGFRENTQRAADVTARQLLDAGARQVAQRLNDQPDVQAALFETMGNSYRALGDYDDADRFLKQSLEIRQKMHVSDHADIASSLFAMGMLRQDTGHYDEAEDLLRRALTMRISLIGPEHLDVARTKFQLAWILSHQPLAAVPDHERMEEAELLVRDVLKIRRAKLGINHREVGITLAALAGIRMARGAESDAKVLLIQACLILDQPQNASSLGSAMAFFIQGESARSRRDFTAAVKSHRKLVEIARSHLGDDHPMFALLLANLAGTERQAGDMAAAEKSIREVLAIARKSSLRSHAGILGMFIQVAEELRNRGDLAEAESLYREAIEFGRQGGKAAVPVVERAIRGLDELLTQQGRSPKRDAPTN